MHIQICKCQGEVNVDVRLPNLFMDTHGKVAFQLSFKPDVDNENDKAGGGEGISYGLLDFKNAFNWHRATRHWHVNGGWGVRGGSPGLLLFLPGLARVLLLSNPTPPATPTPHRAIHAGPVCYGLTRTVTENEMGISTADFLQTLVSMLRGKLPRIFIMRCFMVEHSQREGGRCFV